MFRTMKNAVTASNIDGCTVKEIPLRGIELSSA